MLRLLLVLAVAPLLAGCIVSAATAVVTAPFKVGGAVIDAATTSQEEADRNRGRAARKAEEEERKAFQKAEKQRIKDERELRKERERLERDYPQR